MMLPIEPSPSLATTALNFSGFMGAHAPSKKIDSRDLAQVYLSILAVSTSIFGKQYAEHYFYPGKIFVFACARAYIPSFAMYWEIRSLDRGESFHCVCPSHHSA